MDLTDLMRDDTQQTLTLTVMDGPAQVKTRQDVSNMSLDEFAMLTAVGFQTLGLSTESFSQGSPICLTLGLFLDQHKRHSLSFCCLSSVCDAMLLVGHQCKP